METEKLRLTCIAHVVVPYILYELCHENHIKKGPTLVDQKYCFFIWNITVPVNGNKTDLIKHLQLFFKSNSLTFKQLKEGICTSKVSRPNLRAFVSI